MKERVMKVRDEELKGLSNYLHMNSMLREVLFAAGPIAVVTIFSSLVYAFGKSLTVTQIFHITAFVNILRLPTNLLGQALKMCSDGYVSIKRLERFLLLPTLPSL